MTIRDETAKTPGWTPQVAASLVAAAYRRWQLKGKGSFGQW
jgi:hypothetical protein